MADLVSYSAHRLQHAQLAPAGRDRNSQRVDDAQYGDQHRYGDLYIRQTEPLIRDPDCVVAKIAVCEYKEPQVAAQRVLNPFAHGRVVRSRGKIHAEEIDGIVVPVARVN